MTPKEILEKYRELGESYQWRNPDGKVCSMFSEEDVEKMMAEILDGAGDFQKVLFSLLMEGDICYSVKPSEDFIVLRIWPTYATELNSHAFYVHKNDPREGMYRNVLKLLLKRL